MKWVSRGKNRYLRGKYRFLKGFFLSLLAVLFLSNPLFAFSPASNQEIRGVWLTTHDTDILIDQPKLQEAIAELANLNFNTLYPVVWNSGYALYPSAITKRKGIQPFNPKGLQGQDTLEDLINQAHLQGLSVIPWFEFGFMAPPTSELARSHPHWLTQKRDGSKTGRSAAGEVVWLNPFHPQVQEFIRKLGLKPRR